MSEFSISREDGPSGGRYVTIVDGHTAEMTYSRAGETRIIIDHTEVPDALRGTGLGKKLVERGVLDARAEGKKIVPLCPYAKAQIAIAVHRTCDFLQRRC